QRHDDELVARSVQHADVDEIRAVEVADVERAPETGRRAPGLPRPPHAPGDLRPRVEHAAHALQMALDGVVGDGDGQSNSRCSSPTTGDSGRSATRRIASSTPGMKLVRSVVTWRIVSVWATSPRMTSWSATMPGSRTE